MKTKDTSPTANLQERGSRGSNQSGLRAHNERLVLTILRQEGPLPKAEIARRTGLSAQTISVIMRALEADGLLEKREPVRGRIGQPSVPMGLVPTGAFFLGLKVGRRSLDLILTDFIGTVIGRKRSTHSHPTPDNVVAFANQSISDLLAPLSAEERRRVAGLGIAIPFNLWDWAAALGAPPADMKTWQQRDIDAEIARHWDFPVYIQNDATSACSAELVFGQCDHPSDFLHFFIGFFGGGGIVLNYSIYAGHSGNAGALGSIPILSREGKLVQLVEVASLATLEKAVLQAGGKAGMIWRDAHEWSVPQDILDTWISKAAKALAQAILSACSVIDFASVVIDGWLPDTVRTQLVDETRTELVKLNLAGLNCPTVEEGTIGSDARSLGAASLPLSERFLLDSHTFLKA